MYRGSIPQSSHIFWRCCAPLYIAKLQDKALCRLNARLQKEFAWENNKLQISGKSVVRAWRNRGYLARWVFMVRNGQISHHEENLLVKFSQGEIHLAKWSNFLPWRKSPCEMVFPWFDAVVFRRPYLPHFSSKSYTVWSVGFLTSWALKWYIVCRKWTSGSAPNVRKNTTAAVLCFLHFACFSSLLLSFTWLVLMIQKAVQTLKLATNMIRIHF